MIDPEVPNVSGAIRRSQTGNRGLVGFRGFLAGAAVLLLMALGSQAVLAQYQPSGPLALDTTTPSAGGDVALSGSGYAPGTSIQISIESTPVLLATVSADSSGTFATTVTIPSSFDGLHTIYAVGIDPNGSIWVLSTDVTVTPLALPPTDPGEVSGAPDRSDPLVFALAGVGIVGMTGLLLFRTRQRRPRG